MSGINAKIAKIINEQMELLSEAIVTRQVPRFSLKYGNLTEKKGGSSAYAIPITISGILLKP